MSIKTALLIIVTLLGIAACGRNGTLPEIDGNGIVHGKSLTSKSDVAKSIVAIVLETADGSALCTGTILDESTVLTAAHCVDETPNKISVVFATNIKAAKKDNVRSVDSIAQNPKWKKSHAGAGDLAVIHFAGGLPQGYQPVTLAKKTFKPTAGEEVIMAGYGVSDGKKESGEGVLRETKTTILGTMNKDQIATDGHTSSVCFGDSGGPAFAEVKGELVQWGVAHSVLNKECNESSMHTSLMVYEAWIKLEMKRLSKTK